MNNYINFTEEEKNTLRGIVLEKVFEMKKVKYNENQTTTKHMDLDEFKKLTSILNKINSN